MAFKRNPVVLGFLNLYLPQKKKDDFMTHCSKNVSFIMFANHRSRGAGLEKPQTKVLTVIRLGENKIEVQISLQFDDFFSKF